jgi:hypothetical protein
MRCLICSCISVPAVENTKILAVWASKVGIADNAAVRFPSPCAQSYVRLRCSNKVYKSDYY